MGKFIADALNSYIESLVDEAIKMFLVFLSGLSSISNKVLEMPVIDEAIVLSQTICLAILIPKVAYEALMTYILRVNGDPDSNPTQLFINTIRSTAIIVAVPWLLKWLLQFGTLLATDVSNLSARGPAEENITYLETIVNTIQISLSMQFFLGIAVFFALILFVIVVIQNFIRGGELAFQIVIGQFMALGIVNGSSGFANWLKETTAICLTQAAQMYVIRLAFAALQGIAFENPWYSLLTFIAMLFIAVKVPSGMKQLAHSTGFGRAAGQVSNTVVQQVLMRAATKAK